MKKTSLPICQSACAGIMFYKQSVLGSTGALGAVWMAAHLEKKLNKAMVTQTDIKESVGQCVVTRGSLD